MEQKFKLTHVVLYAKGWYKRTDNIWDDLKKILELDDYSPFTNNDVYNIIVNSVQNSNIYRWTELKEVLSGIAEYNSWKFGYYTNKNCSWMKDFTKYPEYDMRTAFIYYVLSNLKLMDRENWIPKVPKYTKYPKADNITIQKVVQYFNNLNSHV